MHVRRRKWKRKRDISDKGENSVGKKYGNIIQIILAIGAIWLAVETNCHRKQNEEFINISKKKYFVDVAPYILGKLDDKKHFMQYLEQKDKNIW